MAVYMSLVSVKVLCSVHMSFVTLATYLLYVLMNSMTLLAVVHPLTVQLNITSLSRRKAVRQMESIPISGRDCLSDNTSSSFSSYLKHSYSGFSLTRSILPCSIWVQEAMPISAEAIETTLRNHIPITHLEIEDQSSGCGESYSVFIVSEVRAMLGLSSELTYADFCRLSRANLHWPVTVWVRLGNAKRFVVAD